MKPEADIEPGPGTVQRDEGDDAPARRRELSDAELAELRPEQRMAVRRAWSTLSEHRGVILCQRLGAGKTWIALALARVAQQRCEARIRVVAPARLLPMWRRVAGRLGVTLDGVTSHALASRGRLPDAEPGASETRDRTNGEREHSSAATGVLWIVDEAHRFRNPATQRFEALAKAAAGDALVLVTATPINTSSQDAAALLALFGALPAQVPLHHWRPQQLRDALATVAVGDVASSEPSVRIARPSAVDALEFDVVRSALEVPISRPTVLFARLVDTIVEAPWPVFGLGAGADALQATALVRDALLMRLVSHPAALAGTLRRLRRYYARCQSPEGAFIDRETYASLFGREGPVQGLLPFAWPGAGWANDPGAACQTAGREGHADGATALDAGLADAPASWDVLLEKTRNALAVAIDVLGRLRRSGDPVLDALEAHLRARIGTPDRRWHDLTWRPSAVLFTQHAETAEHLDEALRERGWSVGLVTGSRARLGGLTIDAAVLVDSFDPEGERPVPLCQVLVCTDVLGTGHNLQRAAVAVHVDRPWNPVKMAQREGRIVRLGQEAETVELAHLVPERPSHPAVEGLIDRLERALERRRGLAERVVDEAVRPVAASGQEPGLPALPACAHAVTREIRGRLLERIRVLRHHPEARAWLRGVEQIRRALGHRLDAGTWLRLQELLESGLPRGPAAALRILASVLLRPLHTV